MLLPTTVYYTVDFLLKIFRALVSITLAATVLLKYNFYFKKIIANKPQRQCNTLINKLAKETKKL